MSHGLHPEPVALVREQATEFRVARKRVGHVRDEVRKLVTGVDALEFGSAIDVIVRIDEPVRVEDYEGIYPELTAATTDLFVSIDGSLAISLIRPGKLGQIHGGNMRNLGSQSEFAHDGSPSGAAAKAALVFLCLLAARQRWKRP